MILPVRFVANHSAPSELIGWFGGGFWSHMAIEVGHGYVIDARSDRIGDIEPGVQRRPSWYLDAYPQSMTVEIDCTPDQYLRCVQALESQIGKPYDKVGIRDFVTGSLRDRNWREQSAWFCDELALWAAETAGICPPLPAPVYRMTPGTAALICVALGGRVVEAKGLPAGWLKAA